LGETPGGDVLLSISLDGRNYVPIASTETTTGGVFEFRDIGVDRNLYYLVQYEGTDSFVPSASHMFVRSTAWLSGVSALRYGTRSYTLSGTLKSQHVAGTSAVRIYLWKYSSGKYKAMGYRTAKASDLIGDPDSSRFATNYKFPSTGKWRMQAYHSDSDHLTTRSGYTYVTVR
jgi:hypothetical protein